MGRYRKKPVEIEAVQFDGKNQEEIARFMGVVQYDRHSREITIETLEGTHLARPGDWIIRGVKGELYPCKPDIFEATYEPVGDTESSRRPRRSSSRSRRSRWQV